MDTFFSLISSMISTPLGLIHLLILTDGWRYSKKKTGGFIAVYLVLILAADAALITFGGTLEEIKRSISLTNIISCILLYFMISKYRDGRMVFSFFSACIFIFIGDTISDIVFYTEAFHLLVKILTFLIIAVFLYRFFRKPFREILQTIQSEWWWLMTVPFSLCMVFAMIIMTPGPLFEHPEMQSQAVLLCAASICIYVAFYLVFRSFAKQRQIEENSQLLKLQISLLEQHTVTLQGMSERIRIYRHDTRHYVRMLAACVERRDWESASAILKQVDLEVSTPIGSGEIISQTGEAVLDAVLSFYRDWALKENISLEIQMTAPPKEKTDITEFSALVSNALENAVHACSSMEPSKERQIRVVGREMQKQYFLEISNTFSGEVEFDENHRPVIQSEKHGYGTRSMADFAERNRGRLEFKTEDGWFFVRIIL